MVRKTASQNKARRGGMAARKGSGMRARAPGATAFCEKPGRDGDRDGSGRSRRRPQIRRIPARARGKIKEFCRKNSLFKWRGFARAGLLRVRATGEECQVPRSAAGSGAGLATKSGLEESEKQSQKGGNPLSSGAGCRLASGSLCVVGCCWSATPASPAVSVLGDPIGCA